MRQSVAIAGNPNCGKTTLFNGLTGSNQKIGNWPGVTVEKKTGLLLGSDNIEIVDLPGLYSLNSGSLDEILARNHLLQDSVNLVVCIADASNLERNLFLTITLLEMGKPVLLVLNKKDQAQKCGIAINIKELSHLLGIPVMEINGHYGADIRDVRRKIRECLNHPVHTNSPVRYPEPIESVITEWTPALTEHPRQTALMLLEEDEETIESVTGVGLLKLEDIHSKIQSATLKTGDELDIIIAETKYSCITEICNKSVKKRTIMLAATEALDRVVLNKWLGIPTFLLVMYLLFWVVINIGGAFIDFFDILFGSLFVDGFGLILVSVGAPHWLVTILANSVGAGIQTVATFIPIVFLMFSMLTLLEESGYMARASFVLDRLMYKMGLPGKAFVPMLVGFGCTVPAVMATRTLENTRDRYLTVFIVPFMSCGARLPVYALFGTAFFGMYSGLLIYALYIIGIITAVFSGLLLKGSLFKGKRARFIMELPSWQSPKFSIIMSRSWNRLRIFIFKAGKLIVLAVFILSFCNSLGMDGSFGNENSQNSVLSYIGKAIIPIFEPMGIERDNWPAAVGLLTGLFAKEAIIGTLNGLYGQLATQNENQSETDKTYSFSESLKEAVVSIADGLKDVVHTFSDPLGLNREQQGETDISSRGTLLAQLRRSFNNEWERAFAYLLFVLLYFPCVAAFGAILQEIGRWFGWLAVLYPTILGWSMATIYYQLFVGGNIFWIVTSILLIMAFIPILNFVGRRWKPNNLNFRRKAS